MNEKRRTNYVYLIKIVLIITINIMNAKKELYIMLHTAVDQGQEVQPPHSLECGQVGLSYCVFLQRLHEQISIQNVLLLLV